MIWLNGNWKNYLGNTLGGAIAGAGIGLAGTLDSRFGVSMVTGEVLTISGSTALSIAALGSFATDMEGYAVRTEIGNSENFEFSHMIN